MNSDYLYYVPLSDISKDLFKIAILISQDSLALLLCTPDNLNSQSLELGRINCSKLFSDLHTHVLTHEPPTHTYIHVYTSYRERIFNCEYNVSSIERK